MNGIASCIIPSFNEGEHISSLIESIYAQSYRPVEIIVVDGGSIDNTVEVVDNCSKKFNSSHFEIRLLFERDFGKLKSAGNARNIGINNARGEYLILLDSDMFFIEPDSIKKIVEKLKQSDFTRVRTKFAIDSELEYQCAMGYEKFHHCAYRKSVFERAKFNPKLGYGEDNDFWIRARIDTKQLCEMTIGRHLPHTKKELAAQQIWYGRTFLTFMKNALIKREFLLFLMESKRLIEYTFFCLAPFIILLSLFFDIRITAIFILYLGITYVFRLAASPEKNLKRLKFIVWISFFVPYYFIYGIVSNIALTRPKKSD